jgi:exopolyphosphatase/guanosine-5'-triphosphate,3'-diphosphate pyrophosphatase
VATSATRDAANRAEFTSGIRGRLGVEPEVISGEEEAQLSFVGATGNLDIAGAAPPCLVVDIGGGSTEFVMGEPGRPPTASASVDIGCVRMTERHFANDPPLPSEVAAARDDIDAAIAEVTKTVSIRRARSVVGLAGSVTTVAALAMRLWEYDAARIHGSVISAADVHRVCEELLYSTREKREANPVIHPGRVDVIAAGSLVLSAIVAYSGVAELLVSEHDILDGIAASIAEEC